MSLLKDLKETRQDAVEAVAAQDLDMEATRATLAEEQRIRDHWTAQIADLDKAIAALEPQTVEPALEWVEPLTTEEVTEAAENVTCQHEDDEDAPKGCAPPELQQVLADALAAAERTSDVSQAETATEQFPKLEAAYAPVNDEGLMWSNGFEADAKAKAAEPAPEAKRPFWMFTKDPVDA